MNVPRRPPITPSTLSDSLRRRLNCYVLAATAAGTGFLFLRQTSEAEVVYTPAHEWLPINRYSLLDLNHDGITDFTFYMRSVRGTGTFGTYSQHSLIVFAASHRPRNQIVPVDSQNHGCAAALPKGKKVGAALFKSGLGSAGWMFDRGHWSQTVTSSYFGPWMNVTKSAYLGLEFRIKGKLHYGWARVGHISHNKPLRALLSGYAYETVPNKPIITGKTKGPNVITVQPATLGQLALGRK